MKSKYEFKKLKPLDEIKYEKFQIVSYMHENFGNVIEVARGTYSTDRYYDRDGYYYLSHWFEPDMDPEIDNLFKDLLEDL